MIPWCDTRDDPGRVALVPTWDVSACRWAAASAGQPRNRTRPPPLPSALPPTRRPRATDVHRSPRSLGKPGVRDPRPRRHTVDVEPRELEAGVRLAAATGGAFTPQIFLADAIENGAGFVTFLSAHREFAKLLIDTRALITDWENPSRHGCEGSCPGCLRDWSNTGFHPILDWRLAADALDILLDGTLTVDRWTKRRDAAVTGVTADFAWTVLEHGPQPVIDTGQGLIVIVHPLAPVDGHLTTGIATAYGPALPFDVFNFDRRPGEIFRRL